MQRSRLAERGDSAVDLADGLVDAVATAFVRGGRALPLDANVQFMTVMATKMPLIGRG